MPKLLSGAEIVLKSLEDQKVEYIFGYPGGAVLPIYDELKNHKSIKHILARHEQGAGHAAEGYARSSGKPGVLLVTSGPGATNAVTALTDAYMDSVPLVCISGQVPTHLIGTDAFQECDTTGITRPCTKHNWLVKDVNDLADIMNQAFEIATKYATNIKLVYNHNAGMESFMWDKVKETILYIRSKGYRVDGIGWQAHIGLSASNKAILENTDEELRLLSDLIDWAHKNNLEFHITELDYFVKDNNKLSEEYQKQAEIYMKIINILREKIKFGVITLNFWDMAVRTRKGKEGSFHSIYDSDFKPNPAYKAINLSLKND